MIHAGKVVGPTHPRKYDYETEMQLDAEEITGTMILDINEILQLIIDKRCLVILTGKSYEESSQA